ncbi:MAG: AAA family ATPase, partial [Myxococcota bacterium]
MNGRVALVDGEVDLVHRVVVRAHRTAVLTPSEARLLEALVAADGGTLARDALESPADRWVDRAVHRLRAKIEPDPSSPVHLLTVHQVGYRLVPAAVAARSLSRTNVPRARSPLVGRDELRRELEAALVTPSSGSSGGLTLVGPGGIGKSSLAAELARRALGRWAASAWWVDVGDARTGDELVLQLALALALETRGTPARQLRAVAAALAGAPSVLVLDGADAHPEAARALAAGLGSTTVIRTARRWEGAPGVRLVPPLDPVASAALLAATAREAGAPGLTGVGLDPATVERIVRATDGIPLALELAGRRLRALSARAVADALEVAPLRVLARPGADRHASLATTLTWSWDSSTDAERRAWSDCAVFRAPFDADAAERVVTGGRAAVDGLVARGLVTAASDSVLRNCRSSDSVLRNCRSSDSVLRNYRMLAPVRELARERSSPPADTLGRFVSCWAGRAREALAESPVPPAALRAARVSARHFGDALERATSPDDVAWLTLATCHADPTPFADDDGVARLFQVADAAPDTALRLRLTLFALLQLLDRGAFAPAVARARALCADAGRGAPLDVAVQCRSALASCLAESGAGDEALAVARGTVAAAEGAEPVIRARAHGSLGTTLLQLGRPEALAELERAAELARASGAAQFVTWSTNLASSRHHAGDVEGARRAWAEALREAVALGDRWSAIGIGYNLGWSDWVRGEGDAAVVRFDEAADGYRAIGRPELAAWARMVAAAIRALSGQWTDVRSELVALDPTA